MLDRVSGAFYLLEGIKVLVAIPPVAKIPQRH